MKLAFSFFSLISVSPLAAQSLQFTDVTAAANIVHEYIPGFLLQPQYAGGGVTGDFNADGWQDLFLLGSVGGNPERLYLNNGDGTFTDRAQAWGMGSSLDCRGAAVGDYDGDGWQDLFVTGTVANGHRLLRNIGGAGFLDMAATAGVAGASTVGTNSDGWGAAFGDYDLDGDLDLFLANFNMASKLLQNQGDGTFVDRTVQAGLSSVQGIRAFAPRFADMDGDRYPEVLIAGDFGTSAYYINDGDGTFTLWTSQSGTGQEENGMGQTIGDFNGDGLPDWYVTSIMDCPSCAWTGNKLYLNQGGHQYVEVASAAGVDFGGYGWGAVAVDFDLDGDVDLAEVNGSGSTAFADKSKLWLNDGSAVFTEVAVPSGLGVPDESRGLLHLDFDNDGDMDLVVVGNGEPTRLYRNDQSGPNAHFLRVFLEPGPLSGLAPGGYGSRVDVTTAGQTQSAWITGGDNYLSGSELSAHFGLGAADEVLELRVTWADGSNSVMHDVPADQTIRLSPSPDQMSFCGCSQGAPCGNSSGLGGCIHSLGKGGRLAATGSASVSSDDLRLSATQLPPGQFGLLFMGAGATSAVPLGAGLRCIAAPLFRFPARPTGSAGVLEEGPGLVADTQAQFPPVAHITAGSSWTFQVWFRDPFGPCGASSNLTSALAVSFYP